MHPRAARANAGFSLVEVLVSVVVLSFGLLGVVGMQLGALQGNREAALQSEAVRLGREIGELMRGNQSISAEASAAANPYLVDFTAGTSTLPTSSASCMSSGAADRCDTPLKVARWEMRDWLDRVSEELPGARVRICYDATPYDGDGLPQWACSNSGSVAVVKIGWSQSSTNRAATGTAVRDNAVRPHVVLPLITGSTA